MSEKELALFLCEVGIIIYGDNIYFDDELVDSINKFIYKTYLEDKNSLRIIIPYLPLIEECILNDAQIIYMNVVLYLMRKYYGQESYTKLVEDVGPEKDKQINELALKCVSYRNRLLLSRSKRIPLYQRITQ